MVFKKRAKHRRVEMAFSVDDGEHVKTAEVLQFQLKTLLSLTHAVNSLTPVIVDLNENE
jgi:hypothetical protein